MKIFTIIAPSLLIAVATPALALHIPRAQNGSETSTAAANDSPSTVTPTVEVPDHVASAMSVVESAQIQMAKDNWYRINHPRRNKYSLRPEPPAGSQMPAVPLKVATAAAIVAEFHAGSTPISSAAPSPGGKHDDKEIKDELVRRQSGGSFWMETISHSGYVPIGGSSGYKVFRNVKDFGAKGDGTTDDTAAINNAISSGTRCGDNCGSSTVAPALVYFPAGTYLVSSPIISYYNTQLVGNPNSRPIIRASSSFVGLGVITSDVYIPGKSGAEWYINQNNFLRQIRNFDIDMRSIPNTMKGLETPVSPAGIHWQVAQATSLQNINIYMSARVDTSHQGIFMENGSGGFFSNMTFSGGKTGVFLGNQQFTIRSLTFNNCQTAVSMLWDWGFTMKDITVNGGTVGFNITGGGGGAGAAYSQGIGSLMLIDSAINNVKTGIIVTYNQVNATQLNLDNVKFSGVGVAVQRDSGDTLLAGGTANSWGSGTIYDDPVATAGQPRYGTELSPAPKKPASLMQNGRWLQRDKPQYENLGAGQFWDVRARSGARGNGRSDDTAAINQALKDATAVNAITYFPYGIYIVTDTIVVPNGARIVGEAWSQIMASGAKFSDIDNPHVMWQVGKPGDVGLVEMQDLLFTTRGNTAGAVLVEWNIKESSPGSAAMWDCHIRVGGAVGSNLQNAQCPKLTGRINPDCIAASLLIHLTPKSSGYFENVWAWTADHDMDLVTQDQIDVFVGRGWLIESQGPTWLYGTASEHNVLYQYQLQGAKDIFLGMIQTESPYYQGTTTVPAPKPFDKSPGRFWNDPDFYSCYTRGGCTMSWGLRIISSTSVYLYGAGMYSWFSAYQQQPCLSEENCQLRMVDLDDGTSSNVWIYNVITKGVQSMINPFYARTVSRNGNQNGFTSTIMAWLVLGRDSVPSLTNWAYNYNQHPMQ